MAERNLPGIAGQQHQRQRADRRRGTPGRRDRDRRRWRRKETRQHDAHSASQRRAFEPRLDQREVLRIAGAEIAARPRRVPKHGRAPRGCRTGPTAAPPAWRSAPGKAPRPTAADRCIGSTAPRRRRRSARRPGRRRRLSRPPTSAAGNALRPITAIDLVEPGIERDQHAGNRAGQGREPPRQRVDRMQVDAALRGEQRVLPGRAHAHAPAPERRNSNSAAVDRAPSQRRATRRTARCGRRPAARSPDWQAAAPARDIAAAPTRSGSSTPRSRMPSATVVSTAASTISPAILRIRNT